MTITTTDVHGAAITTPVDTAELNPPATTPNAGTGILLAEPTTLGLGEGSMAALAMLLTKADEQDRTAARQIEDAADSATMKAENDRVAQMRAKADAEESAALATGVSGMIGGALTIAGGFAGTSTASDDGASTQSIDWSQSSKGAANLTGSIGELIAGQYHCDAGHADAEAATAEANAQADIRVYNRAHDSETAASSSIQRVEQFLDQIQQTKNAALLTAATFRA